METTEKILIYDDHCPLCSWYSGLFVRYGLLKPGNRMAFSLANQEVLKAIDIARGKNEIPLFDPASKQTLYGIDALLELLGQKIPFIRQAGNFKPVHWGLKKLYKLISYNRKVIVARKCGKGVFDCSPEFNSFYRIVFLVLFLVFNSFMLLPLHNQVFSRLSFVDVNIEELQAAHLILVSINCTLALFTGRIMAIEYLGQVNMLAVTCILLLMIVMLLNYIIPVPEWLILFCLAIITVFIIKEYRRRMEYAGIFTNHKTIVAVNIACLIIFLAYIFH